MKILFVTDLHGSRWKYDKLLELAKHHGVKVLANGGDMLPKEGDLFRQDQFITGYLKDHFDAFYSAGIHYLCYLGNDDLQIFDPLFEETCNAFSFVHCIAQRKIEIEGYEFIGMNWVVDYPFRLKDRCRMDSKDYVFEQQFGTGLLSQKGKWQEIGNWFSYAKSLPTIEDEMKNLVHPSDMTKAIYVIHMPPARLGLDQCSHGAEVGSKSIYKFIEKNQPLLTLHGHIHESPRMTGKWFNELGRTICIQPGQLRDLSYVVIDLKKREWERFECA